MSVNEKYLDHLQTVIARHNSNSFMIKGWTITICTAIFAVGGTWKEPLLALIALVPTTIFWILDSFYLANERCFVSMYVAAINGYSLKVKNKLLLKKCRENSNNAEGKSIIDPEHEVVIKSDVYSMNFMPFRQIIRNNWLDVIRSRTIIWFYLMLVGFSIALFLGLLLINKPTPKEALKVLTTLETDSLFIKTVSPQVIVNNIILNDSIMKTDTIHRSTK